MDEKRKREASSNENNPHQSAHECLLNCLITADCKLTRLPVAGKTEFYRNGPG